MEQEPGLSNLLVGDAEAGKVRRTSLPSLHLLTSGTVPPNPSELLDSRRFKELMALLGKHYDWVILDSPPVLPVTDAVVMAECASAVVLVTAADRTPLQAARSAVEHLMTARAHIIGAVLNRADLDRRAYYYSKYYRTEYESYYAQSTAPA
jgi:capsular exopolysaccharide synthesis family protein